MSGIRAFRRFDEGCLHQAFEARGLSIAPGLRHGLESRVMVTNADKLVSEFRALPAEEKLRLLDMILADMDTPEPEIDEIWANEARKRWEAYKAGKVNTISYDEVISRYKAE